MNKLYPELATGIRVGYHDPNYGWRAGRIKRRAGNWLTLTTTRGTKRVRVEDIEGYWNKGIKKCTFDKYQRLNHKRL